MPGIGTKVGDIYYEAHISGGKLPTEQRKIAAQETEKISKAQDKNSKSLDNNSKKLDRNSGRLRRWQAIVLAIAAASPQIAVLGSAVGGAITIAGAAAASGAAGLLVAVAAFKGLNGELSKLPAAVQPAAKAFQGFMAQASAAQQAIQIGAAGGLTTGFDNLKATIAGLTPTLQQFGGVVGKVFANFTASIAPGTAGFAKLQTFLKDSEPIFANLVGAVQKLGGALANVFIAVAPQAFLFSKVLGDLMQQFNTFTGSAEGQNAIADWAANAAKIFGGLSDVAGSLGKTLAAIVTPELVADFVTFLGQLAKFLPVVGQVISAIGKLGIFTILGTVFDALGPILKALLPAIGELASSLGGAIVSAIKTLAPVVLVLAKALAPLFPIIGDLIDSLVKALAPALVPIIGMFADLVKPIVEIIGVLAQLVTPLLEPLAAILSTLIQDGILQPLVMTFQLLADALKLVLPFLMPIIQFLGFLLTALEDIITGNFPALAGDWDSFWASLGKPVQDFITQTIGMFVDFFNNTVGMFVDFFNNTVGMFVDFFTNTIGMFVDFFNNTIGMVQDFATNFGRFWGSIWTGIGAVVKGAWNGVLGFIEGGINGAIDLINGLIKGINTVTGLVGIPKIGTIPHLHIPRLASGAIIDRATLAMIGEAGREAVVPLNRNLNQVDPSVRGLSAIAQGKAAVGNSLTFAPGSIVVSAPVTNPYLAAKLTVDGIVEAALN